MKTITLDYDWENLSEFENSLDSNQYACWVLFLGRDLRNDQFDVQNWISVLHVHGIEAKYNYALQEFYDIENVKNKQFKSEKRRSLYQRLKPEIKKELIKEYENTPITVNSITTGLKSHYSYLLIPYGYYSQLQELYPMERFSDYFND